MKKILIYFLLFSFSLQAQKATVVWSEVDDDKTPISPDYVFKTKDNGIMFLSYYKSKKFMLSKFDKDLNVIFSNEVIITGKKVLEEKNLSLINAYDINGKHTIFTKYFDKKNDKVFVYACSFNDEGIMEDNYKVLASFPVEKKGEVNSISITPSFDSSKLVLYMDQIQKRKEKQSFFVSVVDKSFNSLWDGEITLPYYEKNYDFKKILVGNDGKVYSFGSCKKECGGREMEKGEYVFFLNSYDSKKKTAEFMLDLEDKFLFTPDIKIKENGDIVCAGFYCNKRKRNSINGIVTFVLDPVSKKVKSSNNRAFTVDDYKEFMSAKKAEKMDEKDKGLSGNFEYRKFYPRVDGGGTLIAEEYVVHIYTYTSNGITRTEYEYHYGPIAIMNVKSDGNIDWVRGIIKEQISRNDGGPYSSLASMTYKDKVIVIWNDSEKNLEKQEDEDNDKKKSKPTVKFKKSMGVMAITDEKGNMTKDIIFNGKEEDLILRPKSCKQITPNEMLLYAVKGKKDKIGKLILAD